MADHKVETCWRTGDAEVTLINLTFTYGRELVQARGICHLSYAQFAGKVGLLLDTEEWFDLDRVSDIRCSVSNGRDGGA